MTLRCGRGVRLDGSELLQPSEAHCPLLSRTPVTLWW
jgi:hypothetical protein